MSDATERWLPIPGWEGLYDASDRGRVWSVRRKLILKPGRKIDGDVLAALVVMLYLNGRNHARTIHALVMLTFVGPCPEGLEIRHLDGDATNNALSNLVYGTHSQNEYDKVRHGTHQNASKTHCKSGHEFTPENTRLSYFPDGRYKGRVCRLCHGVWSRRYQAKRRAKLKAAA